MSNVDDVKEVKKVLKDLKRTTGKYPKKEKDILQWTPTELKGYIKKDTNGMGISKKFKLARELDLRIKEARRKAAC